MKEKANSTRRARRGRNTEVRRGSIRSFAGLTVCALLAVVIAVGTKVAGSEKQDAEVYAASEAESGTILAQQPEEDTIPSGIAGVVSGVQETPVPGSTVERIGTSCESVMVGQRLKTVRTGVVEFNISSSMESRVNDLDSRSITLAETPKLMTDTDYDTLLSIVEAEAGTEDVKGRVLVANVIMNRVKNSEFPNNVTDVVWDYSDGVPQFSPTYDGRIGEVTISKETKEAVKQALEGVDYSQGALFFIQKSAAEDHNVTWFEKDLKKLFKYGVHEFYTYPEKTDKAEKSTEDESAADDVVQMVKK